MGYVAVAGDTALVLTHQDSNSLLLVIIKEWSNIFQNYMTVAQRALVYLSPLLRDLSFRYILFSAYRHEARKYRNDWAHQRIYY